ncbi:Bestrophin, RFP-TM, chloride channel-domain-containing protein [Collybia nuda]|uniref:Bestrophin, RFP-TM, chloride channel-domain-containing protein n=1 Tax=Collybia nuda TaxID=64659 RepID=A0A9P6C8R9_9AGAR|nr:Bestrophin, RFP-TM, chloride channel-domain-containing protein [Collybia nuda]
MSFQTSPITLARVETHVSHKGFSVPDPFAPRQRPGASFLNALAATALFRCWHILLFFAGWSTLISVLNHQGHKLFIQPTLLTVIGTVLGFVISYRTTSSFERYNEGRRLWSQVILASRTFARTTWFHVPDQEATETVTAEEMAARSMIEKKSVINLLEAFAVSIKHYLRGEDGIYYQDLYHLVKFLPAYAMPAGIPPMTDQPETTTSFDFSISSPRGTDPRNASSPGQSSFLYQRTYSSAPDLPVPVTTPSLRKPQFLRPTRNILAHTSPREKIILQRDDEGLLLPAHMPPKYHIFDLFPFSLLIQYFTNRGKEIKGKKAARLRAKMRQKAISHNLPLEISLYLSSYVSALQNRKQTDVPTINTLIFSLNQLVDSLTGLERILTTPIPFSYSIHLWTVTMIYCLALPFQIWTALGWVTIPGTIIASFIFFGFLVAGEEIENPFGYDKNDLNLDHFTNNIIRNELRAITSAPPPDPARWAFAAENDFIFSSHIDGERFTPEQWMKKGHIQMQKTMSIVHL